MHSPLLALILLSGVLIGPLILIYSCLCCCFRRQQHSIIGIEQARDLINDHQRCIDSLEMLRSRLQRVEAEAAASKERARSST